MRGQKPKSVNRPAIDGILEEAEERAPQCLDAADVRLCGSVAHHHRRSGHERVLHQGSG